MSDRDPQEEKLEAIAAQIAELLKKPWTRETSRSIEALELAQDKILEEIQRGTRRYS